MSVRLSVCLSVCLAVRLVQPRRLVATFIGTRPTCRTKSDLSHGATSRLAQMRLFTRTDEKIEEKNLVRQVFRTEKIGPPVHFNYKTIDLTLLQSVAFPVSLL